MRRTTLAVIAVIALLGFAGRGAPIAAAQDDGPGAFGVNPIGEPVPLYNLDGDEIARVTVTEVVDPFEETGEFSAPAEGERFVLAVFEIENSGERPYEFTASNFYLLDSLGRAYSTAFVTRTEASLEELPDLASTDMNAGETVTGAIVYRVSEEAELVQLYYTFYDEVSHLYLLADLRGATAAGDDDDADADDADAEETPDADDADEADAEETPEGDDAEETPDAETADVSAADCDWGEETADRLSTLGPVGEELQGMDDNPDPERLREIAAEVSDVADAQRDSDPPAAAEEASEQIADALDLYANALEAVADALDEGEEPDTDALLDDIEEANGLIDEASEVTIPLLAGCDF